MSAVPSLGSEPFVLARRGLPLAGGARPSLPARWFVSFALARARVSPGFDVPAMPGIEPPSMVPSETEQDLDESRLAAGDSWPDIETAPARAPAPGVQNAAAAGAWATAPPKEMAAKEVSAGVDFKTETGLAAPFPRRDAPPEAWNDLPSAKTASARAPLGAERPVAGQPTHRARQVIAPPLDPAPRETSPAVGLYDDAASTKGNSRAPLGVTPSMEAPAHDETRNRPQPDLPVSEESAFRRATTPSAARHSVRQATASGNMLPPRKPVAQVATRTQGSAPLPPSATIAPARFATPMGTARAAPRGDSSAAAPRAEIAQLVERSRTALAANAGGRVTHRIGTVQVVVQSVAPVARAAPEAPRAPGPSHASAAREPARRGFRNPWASYTRCRD